MKYLLPLMICAAGWASPFTATYTASPGGTVGIVKITNTLPASQLFTWTYSIEVTDSNGTYVVPGPGIPPLGGGANVPTGTWNAIFIEANQKLLGLTISTTYQGQVLVAQWLPINGYVNFAPPQPRDFNSPIPEPHVGFMVGCGCLLLVVGLSIKKARATK